MSEQKNEPSVVELQARWDKIRIANLYDTLDKMGYPDQCLDLGIRPLLGDAVAVPRRPGGGS